MSVDKKFLPCAAYAPDQPSLGNGAIGTAQNVVPRTASSYAPMPSFAAGATALDGLPLGTASASDASGNPANYAGTSDKLYVMTNGTKPNFVDRSGATYSVPASYGWSFAEALGKMYASNGADPIQSVAVASASNFAVVSTNAPTAKHITYIQPGFLLCGDINDITVGVQAQGIRWSALGDPTSWPLIGSSAAIAANSDWQAVTGNHGRFRGFAPDLASCNALLFFEQAVFRMVYTGGSDIFSIQPVEKLRGTQSPGSIVQVGQVAYFLSPNGFFASDGIETIAVGEGKVNNTFFADADPNYISLIQGTADPVSGLCFWSYAGVGNTSGTPNRILVYHPPTQNWSLIYNSIGGNLFVARATGTSLDGIDALGYTLDTLPYSLDSALLAGGSLVLAGFNAANQLGYFTGPNMAFTVDTVEQQLVPGKCARVSEIRPFVEGDGCSSATLGRYTAASTPTVGVATAQNSYGLCPVRSEAMYAGARLTREAGNLVKHITGAELSFSPGAAR